MNIVTDIAEWQAIRNHLQTQSIGFIPTMGNLHLGHTRLIDKARAENDIVVSNLFINPTQFNQASDYDLYPRTLDQDKALLSEHPVDYLLLFTKEELYPDDFTLQVHDLSPDSQILEGEHRPGHFTGMLTIVLKLLNLAQATKAYFGEKDYQQLLLLTKMAKAFFINTEIIPCPTVRATDGLALSSRNSRLTAEQRTQAALIPLLLNSRESLDTIRQKFIEAGFKVDYIAEQWGRRLTAVWLDKVRLIDNIPLYHSECHEHRHCERERSNPVFFQTEIPNSLVGKVYTCLTKVFRF